MAIYQWYVGVVENKGRIPEVVVWRDEVGTQEFTIRDVVMSMFTDLELMEMEMQENLPGYDMPEPDDDLDSELVEITVRRVDSELEPGDDSGRYLEPEPDDFSQPVADEDGVEEELEEELEKAEEEDTLDHLDGVLDRINRMLETGKDKE
jgi:hypothetical protein